MIRSHHVVATIFAASLALTAAGPSSHAQQTAPQAAQPETQQPPELKQVALTDKQVQGLLDSQAEMDAIISRVPDDASKPPDAATMAALEAVAKKYGFANYA